MAKEITARNHLGMALLRANVLYGYYSARAPRLVERFWGRVEEAGGDIEAINLACDALMVRLAPKAYAKLTKSPATSKELA